MRVEPPGCILTDAIVTPISAAAAAARAAPTSHDMYRDFDIGLLDAISVLAVALVQSGTLAPEPLRDMFRQRAELARQDGGNQRALPCQTLAETMTLLAKPVTLAFPPDGGQVVQFRGGRKPPSDDLPEGV